MLQDIDTQDILALNLERSVQLCVNIAYHILSSFDDTPAMSMAESFERLSEKKSSQINLGKILEEQSDLETYQCMPTIKSIGNLYGTYLKKILAILYVF